MKKICMIGAALALLATTGVNAQNVRWGIEGGVDLNYLRLLPGGETSNNKTGGFGGVLADIGGGHFTLQPGLRYIYKGGEFNNTYQDAFWRVETTSKLGLHYIEMPINVVWHSGGSANGFMIGAGGFVSYLAGGNDRFRITTQSMLEGAPPATVVEGHEDVNIDDVSKGGTSRWDAGIGTFIGYQFAGGVFLKAGAEWGMVDLRRNMLTGEYYARNTNVLFSLGYMFGHKKCKE
jgi:hypothetical protein